MVRENARVQAGKDGRAADGHSQASQTGTLDHVKRSWVSQEHEQKQSAPLSMQCSSGHTERQQQHQSRLQPGW